MRVTCTSCGQAIDVRDQDAGHQFFCPQCGRAMPVAHSAEPSHASPPIPPAGEPPPARVSGLAILSFVLGLLSFGGCPFLLSALAITFGVLALSRTGQDDERLGGRGLAIAGITLGLLSFVLRPPGCVLRPIFFWL